MTRPGIAISRLLLAGAVLSGLVGCENIRTTLGLNATPPDEFSVVTKAPLTMPPDYTLRPPEPGTAQQEAQPRQSAEAALIGQAESRPAGPTKESVGEQALLKQAGASHPNPNIRQVVNSEFTQLAERDKSFTDKLIFWQKSEPEGTVIDPTKEAQRLRQNAAVGQPVTAGETPTIVRRKRGILEGIF